MFTYVYKCWQRSAQFIFIQMDLMLRTDNIAHNETQHKAHNIQNHFPESGTTNLLLLYVSSQIHNVVRYLYVKGTETHFIKIIIKLNVALSVLVVGILELLTLLQVP